MTSIDNSASEQIARIHAENDNLQEQINLWKLIPLAGHQAIQMQKMLISVGTALNRQSFIDSNVRCLEQVIGHNTAKIEKFVAAGQYRKNLRSGSSAVLQPQAPPALLKLTQIIVENSRENDRNGIDPAVYPEQDIHALQRFQESLAAYESLGWARMDD